MTTWTRQRRETQPTVAVSYEERVEWRQWFERLDREMEANPAIWVRVFLVKKLNSGVLDG